MRGSRAPPLVVDPPRPRWSMPRSWVPAPRPSAARCPRALASSADRDRTAALADTDVRWSWTVSSDRCTRTARATRRRPGSRHLRRSAAPAGSRAGGVKSPAEEVQPVLRRGVLDRHGRCRGASSLAWVRCVRPAGSARARPRDGPGPRGRSRRRRPRAPAGCPATSSAGAGTAARSSPDGFSDSSTARVASVWPRHSKVSAEQQDRGPGHPPAISGAGLEGPALTGPERGRQRHVQPAQDPRVPPRRRAARTPTSTAREKAQHP